MLRVNCEVMNAKDNEKVELTVYSHPKDCSKVLVQLPGELTPIEIYGGELITACENAMNSGHFGRRRRYCSPYGDDD